MVKWEKLIKKIRSQEEVQNPVCSTQKEAMTCNEELELA
jgi:hypothetical protein